MRIIGCDLHARQQTLAMLDTETGEMVRRTLLHEGNNVREFYSTLPRPVCVGIEATGSMQWFVNLMEELGIECPVGNPAMIRAAEPRKQKQDRREADLIRTLLVENRFPAIWLPSRELQDLRAPSSVGTGCGRAYRMRCRPSPWRMVCDEALLWGAATDSTRSRRCRWLPLPPMEETSGRRCR
jgi:Transposase